MRVGPRAAAAACAALFLDRDGVIVEDPGYLSRPSDLTLILGASEAILAANQAAVPVVVITNQAGIARGYFGWEQALAVQEALERKLGASGAFLDGFLACPYHREGLPPWNHPAHPARKPQPGMLFAAAQLMQLNLPDSWIVGDKLDDLLAGYNAGLRGALHVLTGHGSAERPSVLAWSPPRFEVRLGNTIADAARLLPL